MKCKAILKLRATAVCAVMMTGMLSKNTAYMINPVVVKVTQSMSGNFWGGYSLTGNGATDIVSVAMAQKNRSQASMGFINRLCFLVAYLARNNHYL